MTWRITWDFSESLQFCSYVGQCDAHDPDDTNLSKSQAETEWREWWNKLLNRAYPDVGAPDASSAEMRATQLRLSRLYYDPPNFDQLESFNTLQEQCRIYWPHFQKSWSLVGGEKWRLSKQLTEQIHHLRVDKLVQQCARLVGKRTSAFVLQISIVRWPAFFHRSVSPRCIVIGTKYLERNHVDSLRALLKSHIVELIAR